MNKKTNITLEDAKLYQKIEDITGPITAETEPPDYFIYPSRTVLSHKSEDRLSPEEVRYIKNFLEE